jgi:hypothetical protein
MDSLFFLVSLCGVAWLVVWSLRDHERPIRPWSPFDMRPPVSGDPRAADPAGGARRRLHPAAVRRGRVP